MSATLQVFFKHCFCGEYSQCMCPTSRDTIICPCMYTQTPILMVELDCNGNPWLKAEATQDQFRGRTSDMWPYAPPHPVISVTSCGEGFEALMAEQHANPHLTPSCSPSPARGSARPQAARYSSCHHIMQHMAHPPLATPVLHSASHILSDCPLVSIFRDHLLKNSL